MTEAAPSIGVMVRKVQIEPPTFFLRFKGVFTEDELKEKEEERFKGVVEDMVEDMEMEVVEGEQSELEIV